MEKHMNDQQGNNKAEHPQARNLYRHKEHGGLYEVSTEDDGLIAIWPQGGGFQRLLSVKDFASQYVVAPALVMRRGTVTAEFLAEDVVLPCFSDGSAWNGWGMPRFDKDTALKIVSLMPDLSYNEATGIITLRFVGEEPEDYRPQTITCEGEAVELYEFGGGWTWDSVKFPDTDADDPLGQKANEKSFLLLSSDFPDDPAAKGVSVRQAIDQVTSAVHGTVDGAAPGRFLVKWEGAGQSAVGKLVIYDGSTDAQKSLNELTALLTALYETQPAPADVADFLKERGFVDAAGVLAASRE
jgi:hypothetical protein